MSDNHIGQEGAADDVLIAKVLAATLTGGFYAYVVSGGRDRYIGGPHATQLAAELEAHDWIVGELKRRQREQLKRCGEHPVMTDEIARAELGKAVRS